MRNNEYAPAPDEARDARLVDADTYARLVKHRYIDMNHIPADLTDFDFCWSICALEHLGSIENGLQFIERSIDCLRPGGIAIHTTEFNIDPQGSTIDNWPTVFYQRRHMELLNERLASKGHRVSPFDYDVGNRPMDEFIDVPPWHDYPKGALVANLGQPFHLKLAADGFVVTCAGIVVTKGA